VEARHPRHRSPRKAFAVSSRRGLAAATVLATLAGVFGLSIATAAPPVVWIQAGHVNPGEPGYLAQTGAGGGPFGSEAAFNTKVRDKLVSLLKKDGVDARPIPALVPLGSKGAVFISIHFDSPGGRSGIGYAVTGGGENYYHGEGFGTASQTPYSDSGKHRTPATKVTPAVSAASKRLADSVAKSFGGVFTSSNGAGSSFAGVDSPNGNPRMMHFYGYYRTNADARMLIEAGAAGSDDRFLSNTSLIAGALGKGIEKYLSTTRPARPTSPAGATTAKTPVAPPRPGASGSGTATTRGVGPGFKMPSGLVRCRLIAQSGALTDHPSAARELICTASYIQGDQYDHIGAAALPPTGVAHTVGMGSDLGLMVGGYTGARATLPTPALAYGSSWDVGGFSCKSAATGLTCTRGSHGIVLSKERQRYW